MIRVPARGDPLEPIWLVGEAPGEQEEQQVQPFVGPSGKLLFSLFKHPAYVTNVCHYRPPDNEISQWWSRKDVPGWRRMGNRWVNELVAEGLRELEHEVVTHRPVVIGALGAFATWALTGREGIEKWRGSVLECQFCPDTKVIPMYHPAFVLRAYEKRFELAVDIQRLVAESRFRGIRVPEWRFRLNPTLEEVLAFLEGAGDTVVVDIETSKRQIRCIGIGTSAHDVMCIPIFSGRGSTWTEEEELLLVEALRRELGSRRIVGQNFLYDRFYLSLLWGIRPQVHFDTMIAQGVLLPGLPKRLDYLASIYNQEYYCYWKDDRKEWDSVRDDQALWFYNCLDCYHTWMVWQALAPMVPPSLYQFIHGLSEPIAEMMLRGVRVDTGLLKELSADIRRRTEDYGQFLTDVVGHPLSPHNTHQLRQFFYTDLGLQEIVSRKTGSVSVDKEALARITAREPLTLPIVDAISHLRTLNILRTSLIEGVSGDRIYTGFNPVGTETFRFSSSTNPMGQGTNMQNISKVEEDDPGDLPNIRQLVVPDPGMTLMEFDLSKADLHVVVWESGERELKEALRAGVNIYREIAMGIVLMPYRKAKMFVHGTNYGGTPYTMAITCGISKSEAQVAQNRWFSRYPGIKRWHERVSRQLLLTHTIENRFGFSIRYLGRPRLPEALAWVPQSTVAIYINKVLSQLHPHPYIQLLLQVHDSILLQTPTPLVRETYEHVMSIFRSVVVPYEDPLVIPADCKVSTKSWGEMESYEKAIRLA